jgi:effector-binding domain-containing protein
MKTDAIETRILEEQATAAMFATLPVDEIGPWLGRAYEAVARYLSHYGVGPLGMPYARYHQVDERTFEVEAGFAASTPVAGEGEVEPSTLPGGEAAATWHVGPYDEMGSAYETIAAWLADRDLEADGDSWEVYHSDPAEVADPAEWRTEIVQPYRRR